MKTTQIQLKQVFNNVAIRPAQPQDMDAIMAIEHEGFGEESWHRSELEFCLNASLSLPNVFMMVAVPEDSATVAGYILGSKDGPWILSDPDCRGKGLVGSLAVAESQRGRGIGRQLLDRVSESLCGLGVDEIVLQVKADSPAAIHLYKTSGFVKTADLPGAYNGADGIEMTKTVRPALRR